MSVNKGVYLLLLVFLPFAGCRKEWNDHYGDFPATVDMNVWKAMQEDERISSFVEIIQKNHLDTLFDTKEIYTVAAPSNEAIAGYGGAGAFGDIVLKYHFWIHFINTSDIQGKRKVQTMTKKFALFEKKGEEVKIDGCDVTYQSPLYRNGRYFVLDKVLEPRPNIYEYYAEVNPVLTRYIDSQDTLILDKEKSRPIGFDEEGNTIYDTVATLENKFEWKYFPVKHEFRTKAATMVFPKAEDYNRALTVMAQAIGGSYQDYRDIPEEWQYDVLMPYLLYQGVFYGMIEPEEFLWSSPTDTAKLLNVLGDSVVITYVPVDKMICSNGYAYNYEDFEIPDSLYNGNNRYEGEYLVQQTGSNRFAWYEFVTVESSIPLQPAKDLVREASNDTILRVMFPSGYNGTFSIEFEGKLLFPRKYRMIIRTHMDIGGVYNIYVNDELVRTFDYHDYVIYRGVLPSVVPGKRFRPDGRYNSFDMWVNSVTEYGKPRIRIEYVEPGEVAYNGLVIDYIDFVPAEQ